MQNSSQLVEVSVKTIKILPSLFIATLLFASSFCFSEGSSSSGISIRLTIIPATISDPASHTPLSNIETTLASNELYGLELDANLSAEFSSTSNSTGATATELLHHLQQNLNSTSSATTAPVVVTITAG